MVCGGHGSTCNSTKFAQVKSEVSKRPRSLVCGGKVSTCNSTKFAQSSQRSPRDWTAWSVPNDESVINT